MPDMLVKLYDLPPLEPALDQQLANGIRIRRGLAPEKHMALEWIGQHFHARWVSEADVGFCAQPATIFLAHHGDKLLGFACYDTTHKNFFGPTGVAEAERGRGIGRALLLASLHAMRGGWLYVWHHRLGGPSRLLSEGGRRGSDTRRRAAAQLSRLIGHGRHI